MSCANAVRTTIITPCGTDAAGMRETLTAVETNTDLSACDWLVLERSTSDAARDFFRRAQESRDWIKVIRLEPDAGFFAACNRAAHEATGEQLVFLPAGARVGGGWLGALTSALDRDPGAAAVGAKLIGADGRLQQAGGVAFRDGSAWDVGRGDDPNDAEYNYVREVDWCSEVGLLVRRTVFNSAGGFNPDLAAPGPAAGLAFALRAAGFRVLYCGHSPIVSDQCVMPGEPWRPGARLGRKHRMPDLLTKWPSELALLPRPPASWAEARRLCDRRVRQGKQVLMAAEELPQFDRNAGAWTFFRFMTLLLGAGHHVTFVARNTTRRWPNVDLGSYVSKYEEAGALVHGIDAAQENGRALPQDAAFGRILRRRRYDAALLWTARDGRWFLERIQQLSPETRTVINTGDLQFLREGRGLALNPDSSSLSSDLKDATAFISAAAHNSTPAIGM